MSDELDLESRQLCPDGACVGVLGDDGRCRVCGKSGASGDASSASESAPAAPRTEHAPLASLEVDDDGDRRLCDDGACIGLIGSDGKCKVCHRVAAAS